MGCGASAKKPVEPVPKNSRQPVSTQNRTNVNPSTISTVDPSVNAPRQPPTTIHSSAQENTKRNDTPLGQSLKQSSQIQNGSPNPRKDTNVSDGTKSTVPSHQRNDDDNDFADEEPTGSVHNHLNASGKKTPSPLPQTLRNRARTNPTNSRKNTNVSDGMKSAVPSKQHNDNGNSSDEERTSPVNNNLNALNTKVPTPLSQINGNRSPTNSTNPRKDTNVSDGTKYAVPSQQHSDIGDSSDEELTSAVHNNLNALNTKTSNSSRQMNRSHAPTNLSSQRHTLSDRDTPHQLVGHIEHCSFCPHCQQVSRSVILKSPLPAWIKKEAPSDDEQPIIMDRYDEDAVREKALSEYGRVPGSYVYKPNLTIEEVNKHNQNEGNYYRSPGILTLGSSLSVTHTPFPNYDLLRRRDKRLNKPYTQTLFTD
ncbi:unnamed protein product [Adineta steineri]|uniref:Uncharacterized protein n=1 Tax=Adineta steineri TaxID=433720 RepID=A0A815QMV6_9BILA|nr:unnamed protein product [Adineta steineri]CAF3867512.1 unnamed protein product [Adineta steineri]